MSACPTCNRIACVCEVAAEHDPRCHYRVAVLCPVSIACEHGRDVCPECDKCNCGWIGDDDDDQEG